MNNLEKKRIMNMDKYPYKCRCPNCKRIVFPKRVSYCNFGGIPDWSGLLWCPKCLKGEAGMMWVEILNKIRKIK